MRMKFSVHTPAQHDAAPTSCAVVLHRLLQCGSHASVPGQGHTGPTCRSINRTHPSATCSRRLASPIRSDLIYDRDTRPLREVLYFDLWSLASAKTHKLREFMLFSTAV